MLAYWMRISRSNPEYKIKVSTNGNVFTIHAVHCVGIRNIGYGKEDRGSSDCGKIISMCIIRAYRFIVFLLLLLFSLNML